MRDAVPQHDPLSSIETQQWVLLLALGLFATAIPFTSFLIAAEVNPAARLGVAAFRPGGRVLTLAVIFLDEDLTPAVVVGAPSSSSAA